MINLHVHTDASLLDGKMTVDEAVEYGKTHGKAIALTEHGNMVSTYKFYNKAKEEGVKPIIGCEFYFEKDRYHLILLAKNQKGYKNLLKLQYYSYMKNFYYKPLITLEDLRECHTGLICCSACIGGLIPKLILEDDIEGARGIIKDFYEIFDNDFYLELQPHDIPEQVKVNLQLEKISKETGIKTVITTDAHYAKQEEYDIHDTLKCIAYKKKKDDPERFRFKTINSFVEKEEIKKRLLKQGLSEQTIDKSFENTIEIANMCDVSLECNEVYLPEMSSNDNYELAKLCNEKFVEAKEKGLFKVPLVDVINRIKYELSVIREKGFSGYFLIVYDFLNWCRKNKIPIGCGRGSVAGSEVAFILGIHKLEPIKNGLLFERFLNPTRSNYPD